MGDILEEKKNTFFNSFNPDNRNFNYIVIKIDIC